MDYNLMPSTHLIPSHLLRHQRPLEIGKTGHAPLEQANGQTRIRGQARHDDGPELLGVT